MAWGGICEDTGDDVMDTGQCPGCYLEGRWTCAGAEWTDEGRLATVVARVLAETKAETKAETNGADANETWPKCDDCETERDEDDSFEIDGKVICFDCYDLRMGELIFG